MWWTWVWASSMSWWQTGKLKFCSPWGCKALDTTEWLNWTDLTDLSLARVSRCSTVYLPTEGLENTKRKNACSLWFVAFEYCAILDCSLSKWDLRIWQSQTFKMERSLNPVSLFLSFSFFCHTMWQACGISGPHPRVEPMSPSLGAWNLNHWMARWSPQYHFSCWRCSITFFTGSCQPLLVSSQGWETHHIPRQPPSLWIGSNKQLSFNKKLN